jgi:hypothetical protein
MHDIHNTNAAAAAASARRIVGFRQPEARYDRRTDLVRLLPLWPAELAGESIAGRARVVRLLDAALRRERQRGVGGHWTYDLARHANLLRAAQAERADLLRLRGERAVRRLRHIQPVQMAGTRFPALIPHNTVAASPLDLDHLP